jgi:uncharacterized protein (DUF433 family)
MNAVADPPPVTAGPDGVYRVGGTRVTLDTLVAAYFAGATAETIADRYPTLALADIYSALGQYLRHRAEFDAYLARRRAEAAAVRRENEARFPPDGVRARLLARRPG